MDKLTDNFNDSIALSTHPIVPSPPQIRTLNSTPGRRLQNSKATSGLISDKSMTYMNDEKDFNNS